MRHSLLTVIFSVLAVTGSAQVTTVTGTGASTVYEFDSSWLHTGNASVPAIPAGSIAAGTTTFSASFVFNNVTCRYATSADSVGVFVFREAMQNGNSGPWTRSYGFGITLALGGYSRNTGTFSSGFSYVDPGPTPTPTPTPTPSPTPVPFEEYEFSYSFGSEYGGSVVKLVGADGTVLASYVIPLGGTVLEGGVSAASLDGAYWDVDGIFAGSIDDATTAPNASTARPGYEFGFAPSFEGGEWKAQRGDGLVVGGGAIVPGSADVGRVTVGQGDEVTVWTRVPAGDGMGAEWVPTAVTLPSVNTTTSHFFTPSSSPTNAPTPGLTPTPVPMPTPVLAPVAVTTNVTTNNFAPDDLVKLDVANAEVPDPDFGAAELVEEAQGIFGKVAEGYENFAEAFTIGALTFNEFKNLYLPPPGLNCTFEMGPVTINLSSMLPAWVRGASKLVFLFAALGAMMRMLWEAFA